MLQLIQKMGELVHQKITDWRLPSPHLPSSLEVEFGRFVFELDEVRKKNWESALDAFDAQKPVEAYEFLFHYIANEQVENVFSRPRTGGGFDFKILQGSKNIVGYATDEEFVASTKVAKVEALNVGFMRRLMETNHSLSYSRYALDDDDHIVLKFHSPAHDGSPYKVFHALREISLQADKQDDLLVDEFSQFLTLNDLGSKREVSTHERGVKYAFLQSKINFLFQEMKSGSLDTEKYPRNGAYMMLDLAYRLDFLLRPEGLMMEILERIHQTGTEHEGKTIQQKNASIRKDLQKILDRSQPQIEAELYRTIETFSLVSETPHQTFAHILDSYAGDIDWCIDRKHEFAAQSLVGMVVGYNLFSNGLAKPTRHLLGFYYRLTEPDFFKALGAKDGYVDEKGELQATEIQAAIRGICRFHKEKYPNLKPDVNALKFDSMAKFGYSYLKMIRDLEI